ncbi:di-trans,poly-cis-decaprenylcistransferase [Candidatus Roizmanbacteria bacterium CG02_land_8_20_14_3_00_36_15]|uniref:Isoprenyl transferase n=1 Tax=Candidatus Roizmanbacteria bacterium CG10_big_fil_rev_8_21_14_0_10_36_26 TaxID=1974851 RepID=A0A2M8KLH3_9BACT|nr:MAG: di-trans,poly-cis-decaprenylcistransferase [Candidatus Roizmanbacteria bacterium CG03_land_8_20_14_0_80_36_21]PIV37705.1 MAG: di-trans,poly-cis-decaprenylcistransferase [Candidatus Roizmanbacteria bacterium CG02_land_8_20_14_3_00_36_15]PIY69662.1 MAG: di-trans,poly-cis-decaprenylcistransferase [Candidatus Roizmanbacteria bacterium CG_4_10_14_0_8_um_filter_36_36]PJA53535.1 MAG: di-trans,poly-cis-decaprenylcistransferase [Candidatus Roizmanbacteria bacterium CG_4_9_14_3_um_filter_36_11]PJ
MNNFCLPNHVAIIPDGNRRWAKERGLPTLVGHQKGFQKAIDIGKKARQMGIKILTLWAFSTENWQRSKEEVGYLMGIYKRLIDKYLKEALKEQMRIVHLGRKDRIDDVLRKKIDAAEEKTKNFNKYYLAIALDYGGRDEVLRCAQQIQSSKFKGQNLTKKVFENFLDTKDLPYPNPDLIIRPGGENRLSGFMLWQSEYAELMFIKKYFPDFTPADFEECVKKYMGRQRRFGK